MDEREIILKTLREHPEIDPAMRKVLEDKLAPSTELKQDDPHHDGMVVLCGYWPSIINGSKLVLCSTCKIRCCIAPSTQEQLKSYEGTVKLLCLKCFKANPPADMPKALRKMLPSL